MSLVWPEAFSDFPHCSEWELSNQLIIIQPRYFGGYFLSFPILHSALAFFSGILRCIRNSDVSATVSGTWYKMLFWLRDSVLWSLMAFSLKTSVLCSSTLLWAFLTSLFKLLPPWYHGFFWFFLLALFFAVSVIVLWALIFVFVVFVLACLGVWM